MLKMHVTIRKFMPMTTIVIEIVYRIFEYLFVKKIFDLFTFFVLALNFCRLWANFMDAYNNYESLMNCL